MKLSSIGYECLITSLLCYAFNCACCYIVIQLTISSLLDYSINHAKVDHSIGQLNFRHSIDLIDMQVITRSKAKLLEVSNEFSEVFLGTSLSSVTDIPSPSSLTLMIIQFQTLIIFKFRNFEILKIQHSGLFHRIIIWKFNIIF